MAGDIYYGISELKRVIGNNFNKIANDLEVAADLAETEEEEILFQNIAAFLRQTAEDSMFERPPKHDGENVIDWNTEYCKRRG